jgi:acyl-CoA dehydrogenase
VFNCNAPDTGNMEVFMKYATREQQERWLTPLLAGDIRSSYAMTEPQVASSDATNIELRIERDGDAWVLNGRKWFITGRHVRALPDFHRHGQVGSGQPEPAPAAVTGAGAARDTGSSHRAPLTTLGYDDAPLGHAELRFDNVRVPAENMLLGEGRGFEIAQGRLGPGRMHHCMRLIGARSAASSWPASASCRARPSGGAWRSTSRSARISRGASRRSR